MTKNQLMVKIKAARACGEAYMGDAILVYHGNEEWALYSTNGNCIDTAFGDPLKAFAYLIDN